MQIADPCDVAALEWLELDIRTADARRPRVVDELAQAVSAAGTHGKAKPPESAPVVHRRDAFDAIT